MEEWLQYLRMAERNEKLAEELKSLPEEFLEWEITVLFYSALHYANAFLSSQGLAAEYHRERFDLLSSRTNLGNDYDILFQRSMNARYELYEFSVQDVDQLKTGSFRRVKEGLLALLGNHP